LKSLIFPLVLRLVIDLSLAAVPEKSLGFAKEDMLQITQSEAAQGNP
jgi:hypothetical protein